MIAVRKMMRGGGVWGRACPPPARHGGRLGVVLPKPTAFQKLNLQGVL